MRSSKSRSRNKNRNRNNQGGGNIVNRVFDSSGPEGKVRGTPAQIIEKYNQLARDAMLSGDRVAVENFQQHSEHYTRMLAAAQKEIDARQQQNQQNQQNNNQGGGSGGNQNGGQQNQQGGGNRRRDRGEDKRQEQPAAEVRADPQPKDEAPQPVQTSSDVIDAVPVDSGPVDTPEAQAPKPKRTRTRKKAPAKTEAANDAPVEAAVIDPAEPAAEG